MYVTVNNVLITIFNLEINVYILTKYRLQFTLLFYHH